KGIRTTFRVDSPIRIFSTHHAVSPQNNPALAKISSQLFQLRSADSINPPPNDYGRSSLRLLFAVQDLHWQRAVVHVSFTSATCRERHRYGCPEDRLYNFRHAGRARSPLDGRE